MTWFLVICPLLSDAGACSQKFLYPYTSEAHCFVTMEMVKREMNPEVVFCRTYHAARI
jgi:hypothetical protein